VPLQSLPKQSLPPTLCRLLAIESPADGDKFAEAPPQVYSVMAEEPKDHKTPGAFEEG
jgi:hypothetical protein